MKRTMVVTYIMRPNMMEPAPQKASMNPCWDIEKTHMVVRMLCMAPHPSSHIVMPLTLRMFLPS